MSFSKPQRKLPSLLVSPVMKDGSEYPGYRHLAFKVDNVDTKLKGMRDDKKITQGPMNFDEIIPGWRTVWVTDPDDRIIELVGI